MNAADFTREHCGRLDPTDEYLRRIAERFAAAMREGLAGKPSPLRMLPSYITAPSGDEHGQAVAVDFGGTNVRILKVCLAGGRVTCSTPRSFSLKAPDGSYDYTREESSAEELFDFIADHVAQAAADSTVELPLGHTFSFPCRQEGVNRAVLIQWTKEIRTGGVEGRDITPLLAEALERRDVRHVHPRAVINDTVGTLLAAAYQYRDVDLGSICGTGHNTCYLEPHHPLTGGPMIVNLESGGFDGVEPTSFDREVNERSDRPGAQLLEKMVSGAYLGEVVLAALRAMAAERLLPSDGREWGRGTLTGVQLSRILADGPGCPDTKAVAESRLALSGLREDQLDAIRKLVASVAGRSARLVGATYGGILRHLDPGMERNHLVAIDGSLYAHMPGYDAGIRAGLIAVLGRGAGHVTMRLVKDGSGIGAAIAALLADARG
jgi:hexokinase